MNRRSLLTLTMRTLAAQALPAPITRAQMVSSAWYHGASPFGDLKYPIWIYAIRLRQRKGAQGRRGAADRARHI